MSALQASLEALEQSDSKKPVKRRGRPKKFKLLDNP